MPRYLGQHFLKNKNKLKKIAAALDLKASDIIIEIGPGHGELTSVILKNEDSFQLLAIEKDNRLIVPLTRRFQSEPRLEIISGDVLKLLPEIVDSRSVKICGNIPYYLSGFLFRLISSLPIIPSRVVFTLQREVGERLTAPLGRFNVLSASVQFWGNPKIIASVPKSDFSPPPRVDSVIVSIEPRSPSIDPSAAPGYFKVMKAAFKQPRKTLVNNLSSELNLEKNEVLAAIEKIGLSARARPQDLSVDMLLKLSSLLL